MFASGMFLIGHKNDQALLAICLAPAREEFKSFLAYRSCSDFLFAFAHCLEIEFFHNNYKEILFNLVLMALHPDEFCV
jgi:hypothetical protein